MIPLFASALAVVVTGVMVVRPRLDKPTTADAVVVPSGDHRERLAAAISLMEREVAPILVLVGAPDFAEADAMCRDQHAYEVVCLRPSPDPDTRGQAGAVGALAARRGWRSLAVVTSIQHVTRARLLFDRCFSGDLEMMGAELPPEVDKPQFIGHEWLGLLHTIAFTRGC